MLVFGLLLSFTFSMAYAQLMAYDDMFYVKYNLLQKVKPLFWGYHEEMKDSAYSTNPNDLTVKGYSLRKIKFSIALPKLYLYMNGNFYKCYQKILIEKCNLVPLYTFFDKSNNNTYIVQNKMARNLVRKDQRSENLFIGYASRTMGLCGADSNLTLVEQNKKNPELYNHKFVPNYLYGFKFGSGKGEDGDLQAKMFINYRIGNQTVEYKPIDPTKICPGDTINDVDPVADNNISINPSEFDSYVDASCPSWYSTVTFILSENTTEVEWELIRSKVDDVYVNCTTQNIDVMFFAKNALIGECFGENDCNNLLYNFSLNEVKPNISYYNFWNDLMNLYIKHYNESSGLAGYIFTNLECKNWSGTAMESLVNSSKTINSGIKKYDVIFNIIQIMNEGATRKCDFTSMLKESPESMNIMTVNYSNLNRISSALYGMCGKQYNKFELDNWPQELVCTSNENDFNNCKNWTYVFYVALSSDSNVDEIEKIKAYILNLIESCNVSGSHVYIWTAQSSNQGYPCDPTLKDNCKELVSGLCLYDMIYSNTSARQLDIESMKTARWHMNNPIAEGVALYVISNLNEEQFYGTYLEQTFLDNSWNQGYFYYTNHIVARFIDIGKIFQKRNNTESITTIENASNFYFSIIGVDDLDDLSSMSNTTIDFNSRGLTEGHTENCDDYGKTFCYVNYTFEHVNDNDYHDIDSGCALECFNPQASCNASARQGDQFNCCCKGDYCNSIY
uniref:EGF-like domain-containing protein n=1 Tax=Parastrongyloides trichosuri TaxID=131310 RepID=A0A0N5A6E6_PARTI